MFRGITQLVLFIMLLSAIAVVADPVPIASDRERQETTTTTTVAPRDIAPEEEALVAELHAAKQLGDRELVLAIETELAEHLGQPLTFIEPSGPAEAMNVIVGQPGDAPYSGGGRFDGDVPIIDSSESESDPVLACDSQGRLFAAFESSTGPGSIILLRSPDGGEHWYLWLGIVDSSCESVSLAIGEGSGGDYIFMAYEYGPEYNEVMMVTRITLEHPVEYDEWIIEFEGDGEIQHPTIVTDSDEYNTYYVYLAYNSLYEYNWQINFSRSLNAGLSWQVSNGIAGHCGPVGDYYDAGDEPPSLAYGSTNLYLAYDNYPGYCEGPNRDIYLKTSTNYGQNWSSPQALTSGADDEFTPVVSAVKNTGAVRTVVVAYSRFYYGLDDDIWYTFTQDEGQTWDVSNCLACTVADESHVNLAVGPDLGRIHAAYWSGNYPQVYGQIDHAWALYNDPDSWHTEYAIDDEERAFQYDPPGICVDPTTPGAWEAGIAWTDGRDAGPNGLDVYFDRSPAIETAVAEEEELDAPTSLFSLSCPGSWHEGGLITYRLPSSARVSLAIYDAKGRLVRAVESGVARAAGEYRVHWDGRDLSGGRVASGVYLARVEAGNEWRAAKMVLVR